MHTAAAIFLLFSLPYLLYESAMEYQNGRKQPISTIPTPTQRSSLPFKPLTSCLKYRADEIISVFENSVKTIKYDFCKNIGDGRGITAGRAGFVTKYDALDILEELKKEKYHGKANSFIYKYEQKLHAVRGSSRTDGLNNYCQDWKHFSKTVPEFNQAQDAVSDRLYFQPAMKYCQKLNLRLPLSQTMIYETNIRHGDSTSPSSSVYRQALSGMIERVEKEKHISRPWDRTSEKKWLKAFIEVRQQAMREMAQMNPGDDQFLDDKAHGKRISKRVAFYQQQVDNHNWDMIKPMWIPQHQQTVDGCSKRRRRRSFHS